MNKFRFGVVVCVLWLATGILQAGETAAQRGYRHLVDTPYVPPELDQEIFDNIWRVWPEAERKLAESLSREERRELAFERYGLTPRPEHLGTPQAFEKPLQYVVDEQGRWSSNCFSCHGGQVAGKVVPGLPNSNLALQSLAEDVLATKVELKRTLGRRDLGLLFLPLSRTDGTTNAVMFGVILLALRDENLKLHRERPLPKLTHHDMDAPPWWHFRNKSMLYIDGFAPKGHRALMQFMLVTENGPRKFQQSEADYRDIYAYLQSLQPPSYPHPVDAKLAEQGKRVFEQNCAQCHGTYGPKRTYPGKLVAIDEVGTDRVRLDGLSVANRRHYAESWFAEGHRKEVLEDPQGYVAPPLDGIWASAPYLHNGSVPTLWHLLHPGQRPSVWKRDRTGYDPKRVGLVFESFEKMPAEVRDAKETRRYFDTARFGMSAAGHDFPDVLNESQKQAVLEYLKTL